MSGGATFTVDGDEVEAPRGTAVFVSDPASRRAARATEAGTIVVVVGGRRGEAFKPGPGEGVSEFYRLYRAQDYEGALAVLQEVLEEHPGNALILYNIACIKSILGSPEEALEALAESVAAWPGYKENAADDDDLAAVREDPRFQALLA